MHHEHIAGPHLELKLPDGFEKRQALDVSGRAADFRDEDVCFGGRFDGPDAVLDFVGDVRNHLHRLAEVVAAAFIGQDGLVHLAACHVVGPGEHAIGETLVVAEVKIGLRAVRQHVDFAVLKRVHRARIDVQVRIELLQGDLKSAVLEQRAERGGGEPFAQRTDHPAGHENVFHVRGVYMGEKLARSATAVERIF